MRMFIIRHRNACTEKLLLVVQKTPASTKPELWAVSYGSDTRARMKQVTHTRTRTLDNAARCAGNDNTSWPPVFGVSRTNRRASCWHPDSSTRGDRKKVHGQHQPLLRRRRRRKRRRRRRSREESESIVPFPFLRGPPVFFRSPHISYHGAPCGTFYLPKATSNTPAHAQVCSIVSRPTYRVPRPRVLPSLLCVWPLWPGGEKRE